MTIFITVRYLEHVLTRRNDPQCLKVSRVPYINHQHWNPQYMLQSNGSHRFQKFLTYWLLMMLPTRIELCNAAGPSQIFQNQIGSFLGYSDRWTSLYVAVNQPSVISDKHDIGREQGEDLPEMGMGDHAAVSKGRGNTVSTVGSNLEQLPCGYEDETVSSRLTVCPEVIVGNTLASTTRKPCTPYTLSRGSTTPPSESGAMRAVLVG